MAKRKRTKGQANIYIIQKTKERTTRTLLNPGAPEGLTVPVPHVTLLNNTNII